MLPLTNKLLDQYALANADSALDLYSGSATAFGQSFRSLYTADLKRVIFTGFRTGSPTGNVVARLYAHSGTLGTSSVPTGSPLATSDPVDISTLGTGTPQNIEFTFPAPYQLQAGTNYVVVVEFSGGNSTNRLTVGCDNSSPNHPGNLAGYDGSWGASSTQDLCFQIYGDVYSAYIEARQAWVSSTSDSNSFSPTMPSGITAGDLLVCIFSCDENPTISAAGWNKLGQESNGSVVTGAVFWKIAVGGDSITVTTSTNQQASAITYRISGAFGIIGSPANGSSTNSNPPNLNAFLSRDYLWIATRSGDSTTVATAAPSNYANLQTQAAAGTNGASTNTAERALSASSEDPGAFTSANEQWASWTLAILPDDGGIQFRNASVLGNAVRTNSVLPVPVGTVDGDILIVGCYNEAPVTPPAGWNQIVLHPNGNQPYDLIAYWRRASSEPASYTWTHVNGGTTLFMAAFHGGKETGDPQDATFTENEGTGTSLTGLGVTTGTNNSMLLLIGGLWNWSNNVSPPSGMSEIVDNTAIYLAIQKIATAGATGNKTGTIGASDDWTAIVLAIAPNTVVTASPLSTFLMMGV